MDTGTDHPDRSDDPHGILYLSYGNEHRVDGVIQRGRNQKDQRRLVSVFYDRMFFTSAMEKHG